MKRGDYAITSDVLVEIIEESIRIFWRFVRADKDCSSTNAKCRKWPPHVELQNPEDSELLMEVRANLQKVSSCQSIFFIPSIEYCSID